MKKHLLRATVCTGLLTICGSALAFEQGDWLFRAGITNVDPKSNNHPVVDADAGAALNLNLGYMFTENWALDVLAAIPFNHDIELKSGEKVGETDQLPPTVSIQYHFRPDATFQPYVGLGINYTTFFDEKTEGALDGMNLDLDDSFGAAAQIGFDYMINDQWFISAEYRWMDIDTEARLDGASIGDVEIDPAVYGVSLGFSF